MTLLEAVQNIMSSFSLEEVNSIDEVPESLQVAEVIRETYYNIISQREWDFLKETFSLVASGSTSKPVKMKIPADVNYVKFVKYQNEDGKYVDVQELEPEDFLEVLNERSLTATEQVTGLVKQLNFPVNIYTDRQPKYFTTFDDEYVIFDAYDSNLDDTLQEAKTLCYGTRAPVFSIDDDTVIDMPEEMVWSFLIPEVKSVASVNLLQTVNSKEEQKSRRGRFRAYHSHPKTSNVVDRKKATYGRK
jgi:hypothetical protein